LWRTFNKQATSFCHTRFPAISFGSYLSLPLVVTAQRKASILTIKKALLCRCCVRTIASHNTPPWRSNAFPTFPAALGVNSGDFICDQSTA
jgi:hypothetical protein